MSHCPSPMSSFPSLGEGLAGLGGVQVRQRGGNGVWIHFHRSLKVKYFISSPNVTMLTAGLGDTPIPSQVYPD